MDFIPEQSYRCVDDNRKEYNREKLWGLRHTKTGSPLIHI